MSATLRRKALREIRGHLGAYLACAMLMAIGVMFYGAMTQVSANMPVAMENFYTDYRFGDAFASVNAMPASRIQRLSALSGVEAASGRLVSTARVLQENREDDTVELKLISYDPAEQQRLNDVLVTAGAPLAAGEYTLLLSEGFYTANGMQPGQELTLALRGRRVNFAVAGSVLTPEYIYITPEGSIMPDDSNYGIAYVPLDVLETLLGTRGEYNDVAFTLSDGYTFENMRRRLQDALSPAGLTRLYAREDQASHSMLELELQGIDAMVSVLPVIFLALGAVVMSVVVKRMAEQQHAQIGLLKAFGYGAAEIMQHYAFYGIVIGLMASLMGAGMGALVAQYIAGMYATFFKMPGISGAFSVWRVLVLSLLALVFGIGASLYGARGVLRQTAAEAMRPAAPKGGGKPVLLERLKPVWHACSATARLSLRNLFRARSRSLLTFMGLAVCYAMTAAVYAFPPMIDVMLRDSFTDVQRYDYKIGLTNIADARSLERTLRGMQPVLQAEAVAELPLTLRVGALSKDAVLMAIPANSTLYRLFSDQGKAVELPEAGIVLTYRLAEELGVSVGDTLLLDIPYPEAEVRAVVSACSEQYTSNYVLMRGDYLAKLLKTGEFATGAMLLLSPGSAGEQADRLVERLNEAGNVSSVADLVQMQQSMEELMQTSMSMLYVMAVMAVFACFAIVYNVGVVILSERTRELASMRVLGFTLNETVRVVALEQLALIAAGVLAGLPLTGATMEALAAAVATDAFAVPTDVPLLCHLYAVLSMLLAWFAALLVMRRKVRRTEMADVLKNAD